jgi:hypothetical protein
MNKTKIKVMLFIFILAVTVMNMSAIDIWRHPEMAEKGSFFAGLFAASFEFSFADWSDHAFKLFFPEAFLDCMLPVGLPFSFGVSVKALEPNIFGLGIRPAYHINLNDENSDLYVMYVVTFDFMSGYGIIEYGGRAGFRRRFGSFFCLSVETGFKLQSINFGIAIKLN